MIRLTRGIALVGAVKLKHGVLLCDGDDAPVNGTHGSFAGAAGPGSVYFRTTGKIYVNTGTLASPTWTTVFIAAASDSPSTSPSGSPSSSHSPSASQSPSASASPSVSPSASHSPSASASPS